MFALGGPDLWITGFHLVQLAGLEPAHPPRQGVRRRALKYTELQGFAGDDRDQLDTGRARADDADPLSGEIEAFLGPAAGEQRGPGEVGHPGDVGFQRHRQDAGGSDHKRCGEGLTRLGSHRPGRGLLVEGHRDDLGVERDIAAKVEPIGNEVQVGLDLGLGRHRLRPHPFLLNLVGEAVGVLDALDVASRTRVAVEQPGAADVFGHLQHPGPESELPQPMQHVQPGEAGADHDRIEARSGLRHRHA